MSAAEQEQATATATATTTGAQGSLLDAAITATKQTERSRAEELIRTLTEEALKGTVSFDKNVTRSIKASIWKNEGMNGPFYNVTVARSYKDRDGVWKNSESFGLADLDALVAVTQQAKLWVTERSGR